MHETHAALEAFYLAAKGKGAEEEREACAKLCDTLESKSRNSLCRSTAHIAAAKIRARKEMKQCQIS